MRVFVLLFNARTENEGIHTLRVDNRDIVLMFEAEDDATRFGLMLEAQDFSSPIVEAMDDEDIEEFCQKAGYDCELVPQDALMTPPENNLEVTDWQAAAEKETQSETPETLESNPVLDRIRRQLEELL